MGNFRTDRNNNPTAFTTDMAINGGLRLNDDYTLGDSFQSGGSTYYTARLLGDPISLTIKVIDKLGFYTRALRQRWDYIAIPKELWDQLTESQKISVIKFMYGREGGEKLTGLFGNPATKNIGIALGDQVKFGDKIG